MARSHADTLAWTALHGAVGEACAARRDSREHHRALLADLRDEPPSTWPAWAEMFRAMAAAARQARVA